MRRLSIAAGAATLSLLALLAALPSPSPTVAAQSAPQRPRFAEDRQRAARHAALAARLAAPDPEEFRRALAALAALDEPGALDLWRAALRHPDRELRRQAWREFEPARERLTRKEMIPQVARFGLAAEALEAVARSTGLDVTVWRADGETTVAAAPPYLIERLEREGVAVEPLFSTVHEFQEALARGDAVAAAIEPAYLAADLNAQYQVRIAVVDLARRTEPAPGHSDWLGDSENIFLRNRRYLAYLDVFPADGSFASINARVEEYARRGYALAGFFTPDEFAEAVGRFFPGRTFDAGRRRARSGAVLPALAEGRFHSYDETLNEFRQLAEQNPQIARLVNLGQSFEGRQIFALKITNDPEADDTGKPDVLIMGCHHAREWIAVEPPVYFANELVKKYASDDRIKYLVNRLNIWVVPIVNPDGLTYSQGSANDKLDAVRLWRKNRRPVTLDCGSGVGVDLNRNYEFRWRLQGDAPCNKFDDVGGSDDPLNEIFRGPAPASEPEVRAVQALLDDPNRNFRALLDYHNFSQLVLYPWGHQVWETPDDGTLQWLAGRISEEIHRVARQQYGAQQAIELYSTTGSAIDYAYGASGVPAPFIIEMRPTCCGFNIPEREIDAINQENWSGARVLLDWAAGPPILEAVEAFQMGSDGAFSKLVYSARWVSGMGSARQMVIDTRFPGLEPGRLLFRLRFSRPMREELFPVATLGRDDRTDELRLVAVDGTQGWQKTVYQNDTWVGEAQIPVETEIRNPWRLFVEASDATPFQLDRQPETVAEYLIGTNAWRNYEEGADAHHVLSPTLRGGSLAILIASPAGGERLRAGETYTAAWTVSKSSGFVPSRQDLWLSLDGGVSFAPVVQNIPGNVERLTFVMPEAATTRARLRLIAFDTDTSNATFGDSPANFTLGANVGANVEVGFVSSERLDSAWADMGGEGRPEASGASRLVLTLAVTNRGGVAIQNPFLRIADLNRPHVLLSRDTKSNPGTGARQSFEAGGDNRLDPGETAEVRLTVGLVNRKKFQLRVEVYGVPAEGQIPAGSGVLVWKGKPKTK